MCVFVGHPTPKVTWYKDGRKLSIKRFQVTIVQNNKCEAVLKLSSITSVDAGKYECWEDNLAGNVKGNITLVVKGDSHLLIYSSYSICQLIYWGNLAILN